jgi:hypothetical protein
MTQNTFFRVFLAAFSLFTIGNVCSQTPASSPKQALTFRTLGADCAPEGLNYLSGSNAVALSVQQGARSQLQTYTGVSPMVLFRVVTGKDGKPTQVPVLSVDLSQAGKLPLLIFLKGSKGANQPLVQVLREDPQSFPASIYRIVNDTTNSLLVEFDGNPLGVPPLSIRDQKANAGIISLGIKVKDVSGDYGVMSGNIGMLPTRRSLILAVPAANSNQHISIQNITETVPSL